MSFLVSKGLTSEKVNIGRLEEFVEQIRWENNELRQKFEEAGQDVETLNNDVEQLKRQIEVKEDTIENLKKNIAFFAESKERGSNVIYLLQSLSSLK